MKQDSSHEPLLIDSKEVCSLIGVSRGTLFRMRREGKLPTPMQVSSRLVKWKRSDILNWIEQQMKSAQ